MEFGGAWGRDTDCVLIERVQNGLVLILILILILILVLVLVLILIWLLLLHPVAYYFAGFTLNPQPSASKPLCKP